MTLGLLLIIVPIWFNLAYGLLAWKFSYPGILREPTDVILTRFRAPPDAEMKHVDDYLKAGKPVFTAGTKSNSGKIVIDKTYDNYDPYLDGMNWLLEGVQGSIT